MMKLTDEMRKQLVITARKVFHQAKAMGLSSRTRWVIVSPIECEDTHLYIGAKKLPIYFEPRIQWIDNTSSFYVIRLVEYNKIKRDKS